jgi:hypothetical protein
MRVARAPWGPVQAAPRAASDFLLIIRIHKSHNTGSWRSTGTKTLALARLAVLTVRRVQRARVDCKGLAPGLRCLYPRRYFCGVGGARMRVCTRESVGLSFSLSLQKPSTTLSRESG